MKSRQMELRELYDNQEELIKKRTAELLEANEKLAVDKGVMAERHETMIAEREQLNHLFDMVENAKREWEVTMDCISDMVLLTDSAGNIRRCNGAVLEFTGREYDDLLGKNWPVIWGGTVGVEDDFVGKSIEYYHEPSGRWFYLTAYTLRNGLQGRVITLHDVTAQHEAARALRDKNREIEDAYAELKQTQGQLLQQEKMASIGQLAAGVAHEINNPVGFIASNLGSLGKYVARLNDFVQFQTEIIQAAADAGAMERQKEQRQKLKLDFIQEDITGLIKESLDGCERVKKIVRDLKGFSRVDEAEKQDADINECLETTLNIAWNELKYKAKIEKDYGELPTIECYPQELNQVFMNLLINAAHAIEKEGIIRIKTWHDSKFLFVSITDNGQGIAPENQKRIFEPFFTTKEVGKGTGLGLSIVYDIVTKNHNGDIEVESTAGKGTTFTVKLPLCNP